MYWRAIRANRRYFFDVRGIKWLEKNFDHKYDNFRDRHLSNRNHVRTIPGARQNKKEHAHYWTDCCKHGQC